MSEWVIERIAAAGQQGNIPVYIVGGYVRDQLLHCKSKDIDIAVEGDFRTYGQLLAEQVDGQFIVTDEFYGAGRVQFVHDGQREWVDLACCRGGDIRKDLSFRDFTFNAMAMDPVSGTLVDPFNGEQDLNQGLIHAVFPGTFANDPVRVIRAVRMQSKFDFCIDPATECKAREAVSLLGSASYDRVRRELYGILACGQPSRHIQTLSRWGVLDVLFPGCGTSRPNFSVLDSLRKVACHPALTSSLATALGNWLRQDLDQDATFENLLALGMMLRLWKGTGYDAQYLEALRQQLVTYHYSNQAIDFVLAVVAQQQPTSSLLAQNTSALQAELQTDIMVARLLSSLASGSDGLVDNEYVVQSLKRLLENR